MLADAAPSTLFALTTQPPVLIDAGLFLQEKWEKMAKGESTEDDESTSDAAEYFLAGHSTALTAYTHSLIMYKPGRNMSWLIVGASLFGSDVGSSSMVGLAGTGCSSGIAVAAYNWQAPYVLGMLALVMGPVYRSAGICTTPEFIRKRYDSRVALFVTIIQILFNGIAQLAVTILCAARTTARTNAHSTARSTARSSCFCMNCLRCGV